MSTVCHFQWDVDRHLTAGELPPSLLWLRYEIANFCFHSQTQFMKFIDSLQNTIFFSSSFLSSSWCSKILLSLDFHLESWLRLSTLHILWAFRHLTSSMFPIYCWRIVLPDTEFVAGRPFSLRIWKMGHLLPASLESWGWEIRCLQVSARLGECSIFLRPLSRIF